MTRTALRRQLYREGKRLLGADRMARLRTVSFATARHLGRRGARTRDALRARGRPLWLAEIEIERIDATGILLSGRVMSRCGEIERLELTLNDGRTLTLHPQLVRFETRDDRRRRDGIARGFAVLFDLPEPIIAADMAGTYRLAITAGSRTYSTSGRLPAFEPYADGAIARVQRILQRVPAHREGRRALFDEAFGPAVERLWNEQRERVPPVDGECLRYGEQGAAKRYTTSVIVPIYGRCDFIEHQVAHFAFDPDFADVDLLYVIDDPRLHGQTRALAERLARSFTLPFSVLYLTRNSGFAGANNAGARYARGQNLLLLNSDVIPGERGWLSALYRSVDHRLAGTLLGARLLYEDGTLQHDGMRFESAASHEGQWLNRHPGKGLPADLFPTAVEAQPRQAVTGACLLLTRNDWDRLGGLDEAYLLGDFEDSDLCLRAQTTGRHIRIATDVRLFHLERQSQDMVSRARWKELLTYYNCWYQSRRWNAHLTELTGSRAHV